MDNLVEHEICGNCKKEIPQHNYVMHTAHCARYITLCQICKEPFPKNQFEDHKKTCITSKPTKQSSVVKEEPVANLERSSYYQERKAVEDKKVAARKERQVEKYERLVDTGYTLKSSVTSSKQTMSNGATATPPTQNGIDKKENNGSGGGAKPKVVPTQPPKKPQSSKSNGLLACKYCDLELPKLELEEHENYCGSRTDKCLECGELVMFKYKQIHMDSNHGFLKLKDEPGPRPSWDSQTQRTQQEPQFERPRPPRFRPFHTLESTLYDYNFSQPSPTTIPKEKGESYKEISRRLDCKTEYIKNLLHDSASITLPLRRSGTAPRNHFNHNKGPAPQPPRRRNPPTTLEIPCEFCGTPIPHEDLIVHETGCRPDLARFRPRQRSPEPDDYFIAPQPSSPEVELPCEFCADMIPASQLLRHQSTCN